MGDVEVQRELLAKAILETKHLGMRADGSRVKSVAEVIEMVTDTNILISISKLTLALQREPSLCGAGYWQRKVQTYNPTATDNGGSEQSRPHGRITFAEIYEPNSCVVLSLLT